MYQDENTITLKRYALAAVLAAFMGTANADGRYSTIAGIVAIWETEMGAAQGWEAEFTTALNNASDAQLLNIQNATSYDAVRAILLGRSVPVIPEGVIGTETLGSLTQDLVYTPVFPCRIFDTRNTPGTPTNNLVNSYFVDGVVSG